MENLNNNFINNFEGYLKKEEYPSKEFFDCCEEKLFKRISQVENLDVWELYLKKDLLKTDFDITQEKILSKSNKSANKFIFPLFSFYPELFIKRKIVSLIILFFIFSFFVIYGLSFLNISQKEKTTVVYINKNLKKVKKTDISETKRVLVKNNESIILSNKSGIIITKNKALLTIIKSRHNWFEYYLDFDNNLNSFSLFYIQKQNYKTFLVKTKDYIVEVKGTIFKIKPLKDSHYLTEVIEGKVKIYGENVLDTHYVSSGSIFTFDSINNRYFILSKQKSSAQIIQQQKSVSKIDLKKSDYTNIVNIIKNDDLKNKISHDSLIEKALNLEENNWKEAVKIYKEIYKNLEASQYSRQIALFSWARLLADNSKDEDEAISLFNEYITVFSNGIFKGEAYLRIAEIEYNRDINKSLFWYLKYIAEFPKSPNIATAEYKAGIIFLQKKQYEKALELFSNAFDHAKNYAPEHVMAIKQAIEKTKDIYNKKKNN